MQLSVGLLVGFAIAAIAVWFWREALRLREVATVAAMEACERLGLQFLDGTSAFGAWRWQRDAGRLKLRRVYVFDYTAQSIERRQGFVVLSGGRVESVGFANPDSAAAESASRLGRHRAEPIPPQPVVNISMTYGPRRPPSASAADADGDPGAEPTSIDTVGGKVLDLAEWRRARRSGERLH